MIQIQQEKQMTVLEMVEAIGSTETGVKRALRELGITGHRDKADRRRIVYPAGTMERVDTWLEQH